MITSRVIPRLDIKGENLVKGIHLEGLRVMGKPEEFAVSYDQQGADELIIIDTVASLYGRDNLINIVKRIASEVFIPITAGGGIRKLDDIFQLLQVGVDKVCLNTAAVENPDLVRQAARVFGNQCIVLSVEAARYGSQDWRVFTSNGRDMSKWDVLDWVKKMEDQGVGEILVTSIDQDGTRKGFDRDLIEAVCQRVSVPVVASGGAGTIEHVVDVFKATGCHAVAVASLLHYKLAQVRDIKQALAKDDLLVRMTAG